MSTLHLTSVNPAKRAVAISAVKSALVAVGGAADDAQLWREAQEAVFHTLRGDGPVGLVQAELQIVQTAVEAFRAVVGDSDAAEVVVDLDTGLERIEPPRVPAVPEAPRPAPAPLSREGIDRQFLAPTPDDFAPSYPAARSALLLMQMTDGKPVPAWFYAKQLASATEQPEHWVQVGDLIIATFGFEKQAPDDDA